MTRTLLGGLIALLVICTTRAGDQGVASFRDIDTRGQQGESLNVVFLGGSLTWGANATDPNKTSYRALMGQYLKERYPKAHIDLHDAAIGGTGSSLGMFRLERDVLVHDPDLVFLDFTVNDNNYGSDEEALWSYEYILRRLISSGIAVEVVMLGDRKSYDPSQDLAKFPRRNQHAELAHAYCSGLADTYPIIREKVASGEIDLKTMYPFDGIHPDDIGYEHFYLIAKNAYEAAVESKLVCTVPTEPVHAGTYTQVNRHLLPDSDLPSGWKTERNFRVSLWFDGLSSRWQDGVAVCRASEASSSPLTYTFSGSFVALFGEADDKGLSFKATLDGEPLLTHRGSDIWAFSTSRFGFTNGRLFLWKVLSKELSDGEHKLVIQPVAEGANPKGQLRLESICTAGGGQ